MIRRIHVDDCSDLALGLILLRVAALANQRHAGSVEEDMGLPGDLDDVGMFGDGPEGGPARGIEKLDGCFRAQPRPFLMGIAVRRVATGFDQVQRIHFPHLSVLRVGAAPPPLGSDSIAFFPTWPTPCAGIVCGAHPCGRFAVLFS